MFHIESVRIEGFWGEFLLETKLHKDVNVIIGKNGTGKTNFMNLLYGVLLVDLRLLTNLDFTNITVQLADQDKVRKIVVTRDPDQERSDINFKIGTKSFLLPTFSSDEEMLRYGNRRSIKHINYRSAKTAMAELVNVTSLSVHRFSYDLQSTFEEGPVSSVRELRGMKSPIDQKLGQLLQQLTAYQLKLAESGNQVSTGFQRDVLNSILYDEKFDKFDVSEAFELELDKQRGALANAYNQLIPGDKKNQDSRIEQHFQALAHSIDVIRRFNEGDSLDVEDVLPLPLLRRTQHIIDLSLAAEEKKKLIFAPILAFEEIVKSFLSDKEVNINTSGDIIVKKLEKQIQIDQLSSGEKQILILLIEAVLEKSEFYIFLADEPELSLHIEWQSKIISSIRKLNSRTQIVVATHSPEIAAGWKKNIVAMEDIIHDNYSASA